MDVPIDVRRLNPWWDDPAAVDGDEDIARWMPTKYTPDTLDDVAHESDGAVYVLRGMRLVGKTTLIKIMIKRLLENGVPPLHILYYESDQPERIQEAADYHARMANGSPAAGRRYLFLDGAASIPKWTERIGDVLRAARDSIVTVSGYANEIGYADEAGMRIPDFRRIVSPPAGSRKGVHARLGVRRGRDVVLTPMSFFESAVRIDKEIGEFARSTSMFSPQGRRDIFGKLIRHEIDGRLEELAGYKRQLDRALDVYLSTGGMPHAIAGYIRKGLSWDPLYETHLDRMREAWDVPRRDPDLFVRFGRWMASYEDNLVSWDKLAKGTGITPPQMVLNYANLLERLFVLHILYRHKDGQPDTSAAKKIFFTDPAYLHMFRYSADPWSLPAPLYVPDHRDKVLEGVVATHLMRLARFMTGGEGFDPRRSIFYWTDKKSRPVDFVLDLGGDVRVPMKVQTGHVSRRDMSALTRFLNQTEYGGLLLGMGDLGEQRDYLTVPASVFLMLA